MLFRDLIGHHSLASGLLRSIAEGRLPHALLFLGPGGNGALPLATALATYVNCARPGADDACGECPSCVKAAKAIHPDIHFSYPIVTVGSGAKSQQKHKATDYIAPWRRFLAEQPYGLYEDWMNLLDEDSEDGTGNKQGNLPKEEILDIQRKLSLKTFEDKFKVLILWLPEYLGNEGNRLLKLIEEPPDKTLFILVAEDADRILPTILSRTQIVRVPRFSDATLVQALQLQHGLDAEEAAAVASFAEGSYRKALESLEGGGAAVESLFRQWADLVARWQVLSLNAWLEEFQKLGREKQKHFFGYGLQWVRSNYLHALGVGQGPDVHSGLLGPEGWERLAGDLEKSAYYLTRNAHARLVMMNLSLRFSRAVQEHHLARSRHAARGDGAAPGTAALRP
jgi:DNA polymerase-3 subunit delta'